MFRETISEKRTTSLLSQRSLAMNVVIGVTTIILLGWFALNIVPFPYNYQIMFGVAFVAAFGSFWHVTRVKSSEMPKITIQSASKVNVWRSASFRHVVFAVVVTHIAFMSV